MDLTEKLCFGCEALGGMDWGDVSIPDIESAIKYAIDVGVRFFDVADVYGLGLAEERLGRIIRGQKQIKIATKGGVRWSETLKKERVKTYIDNSAKYIESAFYNSLMRLKTDHFFIYYLHWPHKNMDCFMSGVERIVKFKKDGYTENIGLSNVTAEQLIAAQKLGKIDYVQLPCNILSKSIDYSLQKVCQAGGTKFVAYNVLASGLLSGKYKEGHIFKTNDRRSRLPDFQVGEIKKNFDRIEKLEKIAGENNVSLPVHSINSLLNSNVFISNAIVGFKNIIQLKSIINN
ncbi:MAG: aldo/keto reductase [Coxiellaceae bacterium]|nr:aldo/keto reductase [Coxiellaceae bacterium]MDF1865545.1 aldo/keto reductase [Saprospiraceae bacterium]